MLKTKIGDIEYEGCLFNAAGPKCVTGAELDELVGAVYKGWMGGLVSKSMTLESRDGNPGVRYIDTGWGSINSMGLPNLGYKFYLDYYRKLISKGEGVEGEGVKGEGVGGKMVLSVSGMSIKENLVILREISAMGKELRRSIVVELNLSCPNVVGKSQMGYDFETVKDFLWKIRRGGFHFIELGLKLPPYFDMAHFKMMSEILRANADIVNFIVCVNSIGNGLVIDFEKEAVVISPKGGFGGIGGDFILPTALANVRKFYELVGDVIDVVGVGGVRSGKEAFLHILCGARGVQIGTALMREGVEVFDRVGRELKEIMKERGYKRLEDFRGKLKKVSSPS